MEFGMNLETSGFFGHTVVITIKEDLALEKNINIVLHCCCVLQRIKRISDAYNFENLMMLIDQRITRELIGNFNTLHHSMSAQSTKNLSSNSDLEQRILKSRSSQTFKHEYSYYSRE